MIAKYSTSALALTENTVKYSTCAPPKNKNIQGAQSLIFERRQDQLPSSKSLVLAGDVLGKLGSLLLGCLPSRKQGHRHGVPEKRSHTLHVKFGGCTTMSLSYIRLTEKSSGASQK